MRASSLDILLEPIHQFLHCATPNSWIQHAVANVDSLLIDHANCELKAAQTALALLKRYALSKAQSAELMQLIAPYEDFVYRKKALKLGREKNSMAIKYAEDQTEFEQDMILKMLRLIKEELHHFDQVLGFIEKKKLSYSHMPAGRYARELMKSVRHYEPEALIDKLIIGAIIEARSCERFAKLAPHLEDPLQKFYDSLLRSEARHYQDYLNLAQQVSSEPIDERIRSFLEIEQQLILSQDPYFCFHSGTPV
jgi:tRNA-(ms[2]io[6]A)-hydroxylase